MLQPVGKKDDIRLSRFVQQGYLNWREKVKLLIQQSSTHLTVLGLLFTK
jgi:hypothetical protein